MTSHSPPRPPVHVTCTEAGTPKTYDARRPTGMWRCVKCGRLVPLAGDATHRVEGGKR